MASDRPGPGEREYPGVSTSGEKGTPLARAPSFRTRRFSDDVRETPTRVRATSDSLHAIVARSVVVICDRRNERPSLTDTYSEATPAIETGGKPEGRSHA